MTETQTQGFQVWTAKDVATVLRVSERTVQRLANEGRIPCFRPCRGRVRFDPEAVREWMRSGAPAPKDEE